MDFQGAARLCPYKNPASTSYVIGGSASSVLRAKKHVSDALWDASG
jgi:hypothetical protein